MPIEQLPTSWHLTLHYHFEGNNNNPYSAGYRSDNPWQTMINLRDELGAAGSSLVARLGVAFAAGPDKSVWRLNVAGAISPASLEAAARSLLLEIESRLGPLWPRDEIRVLFGEGVGFIQEWRLIP